MCSSTASLQADTCRHSNVVPSKHLCEAASFLFQLDSLSNKTESVLYILHFGRRGELPNSSVISMICIRTMITNNSHVDFDRCPSWWFDLVTGPACMASFQSAFLFLPK
jgi:hypothetical protein